MTKAKKETGNNATKKERGKLKSLSGSLVCCPYAQEGEREKVAPKPTFALNCSSAHWGNGGRDAPNPKPQDRLPAELRTREEKEK